MRTAAPAIQASQPTPASEQRFVRGVAAPLLTRSQADKLSEPGIHEIHPKPAKSKQNPSKPQASRHQASMSPISSLGASNRMPHAATARHKAPNLLAPTAPGEQPNMPQTNQILTIWPTSQQIMWGGLRDDHFRDLGYPPKFYRVQDAGFIDGSSS